MITTRGRNQKGLACLPLGAFSILLSLLCIITGPGGLSNHTYTYIKITIEEGHIKRKQNVVADPSMIINHKREGGDA